MFAIRLKDVIYWIFIVRGKNNLAWGHCKKIDEGATKVTTMCIYCDKRVKGGGISRFKAHLARQKGQV